MLLLQELLGWDQQRAEDRLVADGYRLANFDSEIGLAIAVSDSLTNRSTIDGQMTIQINTPSAAESTLKAFTKGSHRLRKRGLMAARLTVGHADPIYLANTHPIIFLRAKSRGQQVRAVSAVLSSDPFGDMPLIVGGDFNHYPSPRAVDIAMQSQLQLNRANLDRKSWPIRGSKHEWMAQIGSLVTRNLDSFDADLDAILFRGVEEVRTAVIDIESDHRAIVTEFTI